MFYHHLLLSDVLLLLDLAKKHVGRKDCSTYPLSFLCFLLSTPHSGSFHVFLGAGQNTYPWATSMMWPHRRCVEFVFGGVDRWDLGECRQGIPRCAGCIRKRKRLFQGTCRPVLSMLQTDLQPLLTLQAEPVRCGLLKSPRVTQKTCHSEEEWAAISDRALPEAKADSLIWS